MNYKRQFDRINRTYKSISKLIIDESRLDLKFDYDLKYTSEIQRYNKDMEQLVERIKYLYKSIAVDYDIQFHEKPVQCSTFSQHYPNIALCC